MEVEILQIAVKGSVEGLAHQTGLAREVNGYLGQQVN